MNPVHGIIERDTLLRFVDTFGALVEELRLFADPDGLHGQPVDPANVAMVNQRLEPGAFESYECDGELRIGLNLNRLSDFLGKLDSGDLVELDYDDETRRLDIRADGRHYDMACIDPDSIREGTDINETNVEEMFVCDLRFDADDIANALSLTTMVDKGVTVEADPDADSPVTFIGDGDTDDMTASYGEGLLEGSEVSESGTSMYNAEDYLVRMVETIPTGTDVRVRFGDDCPIRLDFEQCDGRCQVRMLLAPRMPV